MKAITKRGFSTIAVAILFGTAMMAQPGNGRGFGPQHDFANNGSITGIEKFVSDLTEDQKSQLEELRLKHFKEMKKIKNEMGEISAKQRTIMSEYEVDKDAANKLIDQKTAILNKQMKARVAHQVAVKKILTEEQVMELEQMRHHRQMANRACKGSPQQTRGYHQGQRSGRGMNF